MDNERDLFAKQRELEKLRFPNREFDERRMPEGAVVAYVVIGAFLFWGSLAVYVFI